MKLSLSILPLLALTASCSGAEEAPPDEGGLRLCTPAEAGAAASAKAAELLAALDQGDPASRKAACARFSEVIADGGKAGIPDAPDCRWDSGNTNGNPRFLVSLHLTQLKGKARETCGKME